MHFSQKWLHSLIQLLHNAAFQLLYDYYGYHSDMGYNRITIEYFKITI